MGKAAGPKIPVPSAQASPRVTRSRQQMEGSGGLSEGASTSATTGTFRINWDDKSCTDCLVAWLLDHETEQLILFSDSSAEAKAAGRKKVQGHQSKSAIYAQIVKAVFSVDSNTQYSANYMLLASKFNCAIEHRLGS